MGNRVIGTLVGRSGRVDETGFGKTEMFSGTVVGGVNAVKNVRGTEESDIIGRLGVLKGRDTDVDKESENEWSSLVSGGAAYLSGETEKSGTERVFLGNGERMNEYRDRRREKTLETAQGAGSRVSGIDGFSGADPNLRAGGAAPKGIKEIAFFSEPKRVKKKTQKSIFLFQMMFSAGVCLILFASRLAVPQLYENLQLYLTRLFQW